MTGSKQMLQQFVIHVSHTFLESDIKLINIVMKKCIILEGVMGFFSALNNLSINCEK